MSGRILHYAISLSLAAYLLLSPESAAEKRRRIIYNNDGTDMLSNRWNGRRPLCLEDVRSQVDLVGKGTGVTTYMVCTGSMFTYYRSKFGRVLGDDLNGSLPSLGDSLFLEYHKNIQRLEAEGTDYVKASLSRAGELGLERFLTLRMNDLHFNDVTDTVSVFAPDFFRRHPEFRLNSGKGWHETGALDFSHKEVREQLYNLACEQLDLYGSILDGYELDFNRFIVYFKSGEGPANAALMTELVHRIKAKVDEVSRRQGRRILLCARVPSTWESCVFKGLDAKQWVDDKSVDFLTLACHWRGDPAIDVDAFRKESGIGKHTPIYATLDDGSFDAHETYTHGMLRGAASFALSHGADGIYLFNFFPCDYNSGKIEILPGGRTTRTQMPEIIDELGSLKKMEGRNKSYTYYEGKVEYELKYKTPLPLTIREDGTSRIDFFISDKKPDTQKALIILRVDKHSKLTVRLGDKWGLKCLENPTPDVYDRDRKVEGDEQVMYFEIPDGLLKHGNNSFSLHSENGGCTVSRIELILDYGSSDIHGYN